MTYHLRSPNANKKLTTLGPNFSTPSTCQTAPSLHTTPTTDRFRPVAAALADLQSTDLQGDIPDAVCNLTGLKVLRLSNNALTGAIPRCLGNLSQLYKIDLGINKLQGAVSTLKVNF